MQQDESARIEEDRRLRVLAPQVRVVATELGDERVPVPRLDLR